MSKAESEGFASRGEAALALGVECLDGASEREAGGCDMVEGWWRAELTPAAVTLGPVG